MENQNIDFSLPFQIRDKRGFNFFWVDREFIDGYAKYIGLSGIAIYCAMCRHEKDSKCYPKIDHLANELGISSNTVKRGIKNLVKYNILQVERRGKMQSNVYWLLNKKDWKQVSNWSNQCKEYRPFKDIKIK